MYAKWLGIDTNKEEEMDNRRKSVNESILLTDCQGNMDSHGKRSLCLFDFVVRTADLAETKFHTKGQLY